jgi:mono/diheme cytochrome c family protein
VVAAACGGPNAGGDGARPPAEAAPAEPDSATLAAGERLYEASCARCHGPGGAGSETGPPLVHVVYEPGHHADAAFQRAAAQGVQAHHWQFGDMPPVPGVTPDDVAKIVAYVRHLQRRAGIGA